MVVPYLNFHRTTSGIDDFSSFSLARFDKCPVGHLAQWSRVRLSLIDTTTTTLTRSIGACDLVSIREEEEEEEEGEIRGGTENSPAM